MSSVQEKHSSPMDREKGLLHPATSFWAKFLDKKIWFFFIGLFVGLAVLAGVMVALENSRSSTKRLFAAAFIEYLDTLADPSTLEDVRAGNLTAIQPALDKLTILANLDSKDPLVGKAIFMKGLILYEAKKTKEALETLLALERFSPKDEMVAKGYIDVARIYGNMGDFDNAISWYKKALKSPTPFIQDYAHLGLGNLAAKQDRIEDAINEFLAVSQDSAWKDYADTNVYALKMLAKKSEKANSNKEN